MHDNPINRNTTVIRIILTIAALITLVYSVSSLIYRNEQYQEEQEEEYKPDFDTVRSGGKVLFLSSYNPVFPSLPNETKGVKKVLDEEGYDLDIEYMDSMTNRSEEDQKLFEQVMARKLVNNGPFAGVIAGDDAALTFVLDHQSMFEGLPKVFFGVNSEALAEKAAQDPLITGETERMYLSQTLKIAEGLIKGFDHQLVFITDNTVTGQGDTELVDSYISRHPSYHSEEINASLLTREELGKKLEKVDSHAIVLYMSCADDVDDNVYSVASSSRFIAEHTPVPVFRATGGGFGGGITGGMVMDFEKSAADMTRVLTNALEGKKAISEVPLSKKSKGQLIFDAQAMKRFGISRRDLPADTVYQNETRSIFNTSHAVSRTMNLMILSFLVLIGIMVWNIVEERRAAGRLAYANSHDELTGLVNRQSTVGYLEQYVKKQWPFSFLLMDVDDMKAINDAHGHQAGDELLVRIAQSLKEYAKEKDGCVCQYGGDEFLLAVPGDDMKLDSPEVKDVFEMVRKAGLACTQPVVAAVSIGIRSSGRKRRKALEYMDDAEVALMNAKHHGKQIAVLYEAGMRELINQNNQVRQQLSDAMENDGLYMVYQPKVRPSDCQIDSFEALVRMKDSKTSPQIFIGIAEECGWIRKIGRIITEKTIRQIARWRQEGYEVRPVSINYSVGQMSDTGYVQFLMDKLDEYKVPADCIEIEITESLFMSNAADSLRLLSSFSSMGIRVLLDDFGSGYANFEYLSYIPADVIKLDKTLIDTYLNEENKDTISYLITISHKLKKQVVAEGVETAEQYRMLRDMGCDYIQGYYFSRPVKAEEAVKLDFADRMVS